MKRKFIAVFLASTMLLTAGCSANVALDEKGNVKVDGVSIEDLVDQLDDLEDSLGDYAEAHGYMDDGDDDDKDKDDKSADDKKVSESSELSDKVLKDLPTSWDLSELYADEDAFEADMKTVEELIPKIESLRGTLNSAEGILNEIEDPDMQKIWAITCKADMYTEFLSSLDTTDPWARKAKARFKEVDQKVSLAYVFEEPEIMEMPIEKRKEIFSDERFEPYAYSYKRYTDPDFKVLSEEASMVRTLMFPAINSEDTRSILDYVEVPKPTFKYPDGTEGTLTDDVYSNIIESSEYDHEFRKEIYGLHNSMRQPYANTYASLLEGAMKGNWADAQIYGFDSTLKKALHDTDVDPKVYDKIIDFTHEMLPKVYEYYEAKKQILGQDEMMLCDLNQSVTDYEPKKISYEDAVNIGRKGISVWGDEYLERFDKIITSPHVDVYPSRTKTTGAFEYLLGNETMPYVLYNFDGSESYISTIVHEMGHAVYSEFSAENQNEYNCSPGIFTHEVASTANEILFHKYMVENAKTKDEKLFWLDQEINLFLGTIVRQCMYSEFEDYCYKTIEKGGSLNVDEMAEKWLELEYLYYGDGMTILDDSGIDWARIPHLYYDYYLYKYATSLTYAASICNKVDEKGQEEVDAYIDFLKAGNTTDPASLLSIAGVDPLSNDTYDEAGELISELIDEFIETAGK